MNYPASILDPIKQYLEEKKVELVNRKKRLSQEDPFSDPDRLANNAAIDADAAEQFGHETAQAVGGEIDRKVAEIDNAIRRIQEGVYGSCTACGKMIDTDRLRVDPTAEYCVDCQRKKTTVVS